MRKSRYVTILLAATSLAACDRPQEVTESIYGNVDACAAENDVKACKDSFEAAKVAHAETAPKFQTAAECKAAGYDNCEEAKPTQAGTAHSGGGGFFMPMMMGYMMGRTLGGGMPGFGARPVYADRSGILRTGLNTTVGRTTPGANGIGTVRTVSRGGFGNVSRGGSGS